MWSSYFTKIRKKLMLLLVQSFKLQKRCFLELNLKVLNFYKNIGRGFFIYQKKVAIMHRSEARKCQPS